MVSLTILHVYLIAVLNVLSYGMNTYESYGSSHAEYNAIRNLTINKHKKIYVDILVLRVTLSGKLNMSKPCKHCIASFNIMPLKKGYIIKNVYYSNECGAIEKCTLCKLDQSTDKHITYAHRKHE